jgi:uroporphyrinogen decarboxylase
MNSRERLLKTLNHEEPDRIPYDLAGTTWTGITAGAYNNLVSYLKYHEQNPEFSDVIQQIVIPTEDVLEQLQVDVRGLFPLTSHNWDVYSKLLDGGDHWVYHDEWGFTQHFPKENGLWFSLVKNPLDHDKVELEELDAYAWPDAANRERIMGLREKAIRFRKEGKIVFIKGLCAGLFEMQQRVRGMTNAMTDPLLHRELSEKLIGKLADLKIEFWEMALDELGDVVDIVGEGDDYGTQDSQLIAPDAFRAHYKPHTQRVLEAIKRKAPNAKIMFHSCGNVRPIIPDFIEVGVDILNPIHITAEGMEPFALKKDFGNDIVFWGGGVETQKILPLGSEKEVIDDVKRNIDALAQGGGFVFATVHNIQAEVPPRNIMAMWNTLMECGRY